jgi:hypothetical protein
VRHYCTYFDSNYLPYGLALYESLRRHARPFTLHVLCFDDAAYEYFERAGLEGIRAIRLSELEVFDPALLAVKPTRSRVEYFFTCTPDLVRFVMDREPGIADVTYVDADLYFFADPAPIFTEIGTGSIGIIAHRFPAEQKHLEKYGVYNVGFLFFRNDAEARRCLEWWRDRCLEWCYDRVEDGRFGDQKYLDQWPALFRGVVVIQNPGANLAPWNQSAYPVESRGGIVCAGGQPLIFYHFHGLRLVAGAWRRGVAHYAGRMSPLLKSKVYVPYINELHRLQQRSRAGAAPTPKARSAHSLVNEQLLVLAGPVTIDVRLADIVKPFASIYRGARRAMGGS